MRKLLSISEALQQLAISDEAEELDKKFRSLPSDPNVEETDCDYCFDSDTPEGYGWDNLLKYLDPSLIMESNNTDAEIPETGDIALLRVKLTNPKDGKKLYLGYERRPVLILSAKSSTIDELEITHSASYKGNELINIGHFIGKDGRDSYINIYNSDKYKDLPVAYQFPTFDPTTNKPLTENDVNEMFAKRFGKVYTRKKDMDSILLVDFHYSDNFITRLDNETMKEIFNALNTYLEKNTVDLY